MELESFPERRLGGVAGAGAHASRWARAFLRELFAQDPRRGERLALEFAGLYFDYSKHRITDETVRMLAASRAHAGWRSGGRRCLAARRSIRTE